MQGRTDLRSARGGDAPALNDYEPPLARQTRHSKYRDSPLLMDRTGRFRVASCAALVAYSGEISSVASGSPFLIGTSTPADCSQRAARRTWSRRLVAGESTPSAF